MPARLRTVVLLLMGLASCIHAPTAAPVGDTVYRNGYIYTVDAKDSVQQALAVREGKIVYVGSDSGVQPYIGKETKVVDLQGRMMMPGLVDGHMHPLQAGAIIVGCNLNYEALTIAQFQTKIQACLDKTRDQEPDGWLEVRNWFQQKMQPPGTDATRVTLDALKTKRPILVRTSFGHSTLANSRALQLAHITAETPNPPAGKIAHDAAGKPTGILEDSAQYLYDKILPPMTNADLVAAAQASLEAMRKQGVTTFFDASASEPSFAGPSPPPSTAHHVIGAYTTLQKAGMLTARASFAPVIGPALGKDPDKAVASVLEYVHKYDQGPVTVQPGITVRNVKLFMDGVITAPSFTGVMVAPYLKNAGTPGKPKWVGSDSKGPAPYFPTEVLKPLLLKLAAAGLDIHIHADGDGAVRYSLDGFEAMRAKFPGTQIRAAIAHDEIVHPDDFPRFGKFDVIPVLSFQWAKPASDTIDGARDYLGPDRFKYMEPEGFLHNAGARIAYGSDWPVDALDEWYALKVGVTRTAGPSVGAKYAGKLSDDPGLSRQTVVRAITMNSSYELHQENETGSLEVGKMADLIVLDRNLFKIPAEQIADIHVLLTVVGGKVVHQSDQFK